MMLLDQNTALHLRYPGFRSFKAREPIHYRHRLCRMALVLDTLDERISELAPAYLALDGDDLCEDCIYRRKRGAEWENICIGRPTRKDREISFSQVLTRTQIPGLPGYQNARTIWATRNTRVTLSARLAALDLTEKEHTTTLGTLLRAVVAASGSPNEVLALIADGTLQIDVRQVLTPTTPVRRRAANSA